MKLKVESDYDMLKKILSQIILNNLVYTKASYDSE